MWAAARGARGVPLEIGLRRFMVISPYTEVEQDPLRTPARVSGGDLEWTALHAGPPPTGGEIDTGKPVTPSP